MMEAKRRYFGWLLHLMGAACLMAGLAACTPDDVEDILNGDTNSEEKKDDTKTDKNSVTVTANGAKVTRGDFSINFPKGTFSKDAKVTVVEAKKGDICGEDEISAFYKVTMPVTTHKPNTIKIKCGTKSNDIFIILHSSYLSRSIGKITESNYILPTTYSDGEYTSQISAIENGVDTESDDITIGLARIKSIAGKTRGSDDAIAEGEVKGVKWKLCVDPNANKASFSHALDKNTVAIVEKYIKDAITIIRNQGYEIQDKNRVIPYYYTILDGQWGHFNQSWLGSEYSTINLSVRHINNKIDSDSLSLKSTVLHETFHYFQAEYDPRDAFDKKGGPGGKHMENENILYEMGAVWMEQFVRGGNLDPEFLRKVPFYEERIHIVGLGLEEQRWGKEFDINEANMYQGYSMAPLLYYFTTELKEYGFNTKAVKELHQLWHEKWRSKTWNGKWGNERYTAYFIIDEWARSYSAPWLYGFFYGDVIDDHYLKLWKGKLVNGFHISTLMPEDHVIRSSQNTRKYQFVDNCYPLGCAVQQVALRGFKDSVMTNKELVIKQYSKDVHTYVIMTDDGSNMQNYRQVTRNNKIFAVEVGDSIVLNGQTLESLRLTKGSYAGQYAHEFYLITTNKSNSMHSTTVNPYQVTFELRNAKNASVSPSKLVFPAGGGTKTVTVTINDNGYKKYGCVIEDKDKSWLSRTFGSGNTVNITAQANTTGEPRTAVVKCYVTKDESGKEESRVYLPVMITQEANTGGGQSDVHVKRIDMGLCTGSLTCQNDGVPSYDVLSFANIENCSFKQSGSTLSVSYTTTTKTGVKKTVSFDIVNLVSTSQNYIVKNFKYTESASGNNGYELSFVLGDIPLKSGGKFISKGRDNLWTQNPEMKFELTASEGLKVISYSKKYSNGRTYDYVGSSTDNIKLWAWITEATIDGK